MAALAPYAASDAVTRGRRYPESPPGFRSEFQRDRDRVIHSGAFRRLEYKTQVFVNHVGDMFRTRLTHSIEVAQLGRTMSGALNLNEALTEAISLSHDLGHTPFGHAGQDALNLCMKNFGGFEHNLQSLRVVDQLEEKYAEFAGLNLTFETREGILKHCSIKNAQVLGELGQRFLENRQPTLEAQLANVADEIAYNNHDVDDGLRAGMLEVDGLCELPLFAEQYQEVISRYPDLSKKRIVHEIIRRMINLQVADVITASRDRLETLGPGSVEEVREHPTPLIGYSDEMAEQIKQLKRYLFKHLYRHYRVYRMSVKAKNVVKSLFEIFMDDPRLLPPDAQHSVQLLQQQDGEPGRARAVADYIAGMTDRYALVEHQRLFHPTQLT